MDVIRSKDQVKKPAVSTHGETVYELIGRTLPGKVDANHSLAHIEITPGGASLLHYHKTCQETFYILSGSAAMKIDGVEYPLEPGQAVHITPGQVHQITNTSEQPLSFLAVCVPAWYFDDSVFVE